MRHRLLDAGASPPPVGAYPADGAQIAGGSASDDFILARRWVMDLPRVPPWGAEPPRRRPRQFGAPDAALISAAVAAAAAPVAPGRPPRRLPFRHGGSGVGSGALSSRMPLLLPLLLLAMLCVMTCTPLGGFPVAAALPAPRPSPTPLPESPAEIANDFRSPHGLQAQVVLGDDLTRGVHDGPALPHQSLAHHVVLTLTGSIEQASLHYRAAAAAKSEATAASGSDADAGADADEDFPAWHDDPDDDAQTAAGGDSGGGLDGSQPVALPYAPLELRASFRTPMLIERGTRRFERHELLPETSFYLTTNQAGRASFSLPLEAGTPRLYVRYAPDALPADTGTETDAQAPTTTAPGTPAATPSGSERPRASPASAQATAAPWHVVETSAFLCHAIANTDGRALLAFKQHPRAARASSLTSPISPVPPTLPSPDEEETDRRIVADWTRFQQALQVLHRQRRDGGMDAEAAAAERQIRYHPLTDHVQLHLQYSDPTPDLHHTAEHAEHAQATYHDDAGQALSLLHSRATARWSWHNWLPRPLIAEWLEEKIINLWFAICHWFSEWHMYLQGWVRSIRRHLHWDPVLRVTQYLGFYFRILAPVGFRGLHILRQRAHTWGQDMLDGLDQTALSLSKRFVGRDVSLMGMHQDVDQTTRHARKPPADARGSANGDASAPAAPFGLADMHINGTADAQTHVMQDRILNNLDKVRPANQSLWRSLVGRIADMGKRAVAIITEHLGEDVSERMRPQLRAFHRAAGLSPKGFLQRSLLSLMDAMRALFAGFTAVFSTLYEELTSIMPLFWGIALDFMTMPLKIGFLKQWYFDFVADVTNRYDVVAKTGFRHLGLRYSDRPVGMDCTFLDLLGVLGSSITTWSYMAYNNGAEPFSYTDLQVMSTVTRNELILHTWNQDPRTASGGDTDIETWRLGLYDWMPRGSLTIMESLFTWTFGLPMLLSGGSPGEPGPMTIVPQMFNSLADVLTLISEYPMTQLFTTNTTLLDASQDNPDPRFLGYWAAKAGAMIVQLVRPLMGRRFNAHPGYAISQLVVVGVPMTVYSTRITWDTGKDIARTDKPRLFVWMLMWFDILIEYAHLVIAFLPVSDDQQAKLWMIVSQIGLVSWNVQTHIFMKCRIVGMLSSSWQGSAPSHVRTIPLQLSAANPISVANSHGPVPS
ncbi:hypothetical protein CXG81DRAFT_24995 [Caulochytrium protostelioides]|uniref:Uncharacterized protein n=1 Tax=Caulochytrium protostelioides TaxID=1555241 RepID=A0A4P9XAJ3_9FUNG|nr:hypothetical protein CXG81DRAFT_24995 [Caulochytrium protostelioides]|eukprot:RKP02377.1 hypothetical protein CXG81DRAFT_24995 [Caulochytrium protostelioides]